MKTKVGLIALSLSTVFLLGWVIKLRHQAKADAAAYVRMVDFNLRQMTPGEQHLRRRGRRPKP